jgi:prophage antirepressor-like protein
MKNKTNTTTKQGVNTVDALLANSPLGELFLFEGHAVRVLGTPDNPLFVASDVCDVLGISKHRDALARLPEWGKGPAWNSRADKFSVANSDGIAVFDAGIPSTQTGRNSNPSVGISDVRGNPNLATVTESGLYTLVLRSDKPNALHFQKWICTEALPALRKQGFYVREGMDTRLARVERARALRAQRVTLTTQARALGVEIARLEELGDDAVTVAEALAEAGEDMALLAAISRCLAYARRNAIPVGKRGGKMPIPRPAIRAALDLDQAKLPLRSTATRRKKP